MALDATGLGMSKRLHVGLGVFVAVWNVAASVLFGGGLLTPRTVGILVALVGVPFLVLGGADRPTTIPRYGSLDAERSIGLGDAFVGSGVVLSMTIPVAFGATDSSDLIVAGLSVVAGGALAVMGALVALGRYDLPE